MEREHYVTIGAPSTHRKPIVIMKHLNTLALCTFLSLVIQDVTSFAPSNMPIRLASLRSSQGEEEPELSSEGFFEMKQIPTATSSARLDQIVDCSESGECSVIEMAMMIEELEQLNAACLDATGSSRECLLDTVAARNVLKVALASKVILQQRNQRQDAECDLQALMNPYAELHNLNDECFDQYMHTIPTSTTNDRTKAIHLDRIVECAEAGDCPVGEIANMIDGESL
jgi:hypothetical protein